MIAVRDVAETLGVHPHTVKRIPPSKLPYVRVGARGDRRYAASDVMAYLDARRVGAPEPSVALAELRSFARSHAALSSGRGSADDVLALAELVDARRRP